MPYKIERRRFMKMAGAGLALLYRAAPAWPGPPAELPVEWLEDDVPDALLAWHLYPKAESKAAVDDIIAFIGRYDVNAKGIWFGQPPWITVAFPPGKMDGKPETFQAFGVATNDAPAGLDEYGDGRFTGVIRIHRPELSLDYKIQNQIWVFRIELSRTEPIKLKRPIERLKDDVPAVIRSAQDRLRGQLEKEGLKFAFDPSSPLEQSWYGDQIALTALATAKPPFSLKPVPYATVSVLFDPQTGSAARVILMRRLHADPPD